MKKLIILITIIAATSLVRAGEIVPVWNHPFESTVTDFDIMPGGDDFILTTYEGRLEIRSIADGTLKRDFTIPTEGIVVHNLEITPDSTRILLTVGGYGEHDAGFELRSLEDFSLIKKFELQLEGDIKNEENLYYRNRIEVTKIDPMKPYVYFILKKDINGGQFNKNYDYYAIKVYNYETMEEVSELRGYKNDYMKIIDISHDGKYLASIDEGGAFINVWDLDSFEHLRNFRVSEYYEDISWETDIRSFQFSKSNHDIIYFSGMISDIEEPKESSNGVFKYSIQENKHHKILLPNTRSGGLFIIENERILFLNAGSKLLFYNYTTQEIETDLNQDKTNSITNNCIYSTKHKVFIGSSARGVFEKDIRAIKYFTLTDIKNQNSDDNIIYPNPATKNLQIGITCLLPVVQLELIDISGTILKNEIVTVLDGYVYYDLSEFPSGNYFIRLNCGETVNTYKVIKEG